MQYRRGNGISAATFSAGQAMNNIVNAASPDILHPQVQQSVQQLDIACTVVACDNTLADTAEFCAHYGFSMNQSANALLIGSRKGEGRYACCLVLANCRLDVNNIVRKKLALKKVSFANPDITRELTGMELGGVTPLALPDDIPVWIDSRVMACDQIIIGGGNRESKLLLPPDQLLKAPNTEVVEGMANPIEA